MRTKHESIADWYEIGRSLARMDKAAGRTAPRAPDDFAREVRATLNADAAAHAYEVGVGYAMEWGGGA